MRLTTKKMKQGKTNRKKSAQEIDIDAQMYAFAHSRIPYKIRSVGFMGEGRKGGERREGE